VSSNPLTHSKYRRLRKQVLSGATICGICTLRNCPLCNGRKCGNKLSHLDHKKPRAKGGPINPLTNGQAAHGCCNLSKGTKDQTEVLRHSHPW